MKILHTGDWHLGHTLYNHDRAEEHEYFLRQIQNIVLREQPDAMIVSGDVYHYATPSAAAQKIYCDYLLLIHEACPSMQIIVTAGNHDSASKLMVNYNLWKHFNLHTIGHTATDNYDDFIIEIKKNDVLTGYVVAFPFAYPRFLPEHYYTDVLDYVDHKNTQHVPVVVSAHLAITASDYSCHTNIGTLDCVNADIFGHKYCYMALGHIHRAQTLSHQPTVRYSGTPIGVSFDEDIASPYSSEPYMHSVSMVECTYNTVNVTPIEIKSLRPLKTIPAQPSEWSTALQALKDLPADDPSYIRLNVLVTDYAPYNANALANEACEGKACRFCHILTTRNKAENTPYDENNMSIDDFQKNDYLHIARTYYENQYKEALPQEMEHLLQEVYEELNMEERL